MNTDDLHDFESSLRALRPRKPGPLPERRWSQGSVWLSAVAAVLVGAVVALWPARDVQPLKLIPVPPVAARVDASAPVRLGALRRHVADPGALLAALDAQADRLMRPVGGERFTILPTGD